MPRQAARFVATVTHYGVSETSATCGVKVLISNPLTGCETNTQ